MGLRPLEICLLLQIDFRRQNLTSIDVTSIDVTSIDVTSIDVTSIDVTSKVDPRAVRLMYSNEEERAN